MDKPFLITFLISHFLVLALLLRISKKQFLSALVLPLIPDLFLFNFSLKSHHKLKINKKSFVFVYALVVVHFLSNMTCIYYLWTKGSLSSIEVFLINMRVSMFFCYFWIIQKMAKKGFMWLVLGFFVPVISQTLFYFKNKNEKNIGLAFSLYFATIAIIILYVVIYIKFY